MTSSLPILCFIDDDPAVRAAFERTVSDRNLTVRCFASARDCLASESLLECFLLITDLRMPDMDGLEVLSRVRQIAPDLPVVLATGYGEVSTAVRAMKNGARDYLQKPLDRNEILRIVDAALAESRQPATFPTQALTPMEKRVLQLILDGKSNREMAALLCRSRRTVEVHRARVMRKFDAHNLADLARNVRQPPPPAAE
jgi:two-component system response regulator FixJ